MVLISSCAVHSILFLIFAFCNASGIFIVLGAEYISMILIAVYVGAVAILFLFVIMMIDIDNNEIVFTWSDFIPFMTVISTIGSITVWSIVSSDFTTANLYNDNIENARAIASLLYSYYLAPFQMSGLILLIAMIGSIVLTLDPMDPRLKRQNISDQISRSKNTSIKLVNIKPGTFGLFNEQYKRK